MQTLTKSVLIVDDDPDIRANIKDILDDLGYNTDAAEDGYTALEKMRAKPFDVALLDYKMPGMDGVTLSRELRKISQEISVIMITAYPSHESIEQGSNQGSWKVLQKPVNIDLLLPMVRLA